MDISTLPGYTAYVTTLTTAPQFSSPWADAQAQGLTANQFAIQRIAVFMAQTAGQAAQTAFQLQNQQTIAATIAADTTVIMGQ